VDPWHPFPRPRRPEAFQLAVDTREQRPFWQPGSESWIVQRTIKLGDYSCVGDEDVYAAERKSLEDLYSSLIQSRREETELRKAWAEAGSPEPRPDFLGREERKWRAMGRDLWRAALIIEGEWADVLDPHRLDPAFHSLAAPQSIASTVVSWCTRYRIQVWAPGRSRAARLCAQVLARWWIERRELEAAALAKWGES
jgi:hypothetical protein